MWLDKKFFHNDIYSHKVSPRERDQSMEAATIIWGINTSENDLTRVGTMYHWTDV